MTVTGPTVPSVFTIVHAPAWLGIEIGAVQVPVEVYPGGIGDSVAVHVVLGVYPLTVKPHGAPSETLALGGDTVPLVHTRVTVTDAPSFGMKSLETVNAATALFTIVQEPVVIVFWQLETV